MRKGFTSTQIDMGALELRDVEYQQGHVSSTAVIDQASALATRLRQTVPQDPTLLVRAALVSMFTE